MAPADRCPCGNPVEIEGLCVECIATCAGDYSKRLAACTREGRSFDSEAMDWKARERAS